MSDMNWPELGSKNQEGGLPFGKILIANRGEIAVRIARACLAMGITSVAVYSEADQEALHVRSCDEAYFIGPAPALESYLRGDKILEMAALAGCDAIHPGYGFLSENADFARAVQAAGLVWIGPGPEAIALMGSKIESKRLAEESDVPIVPGYFGDDQSPMRLTEEAERVGYPVLIKASAGGGGKGMRVVDSPVEFVEALEGAQREALSAFGDASVMLEKYLSEPRHIEVQVLGDAYGHLIHLGERECSIQRRHQKVVEESPSPAIDEALRAQITGAALKLARKAGYQNAGTVEFIFQDGRYYFLEMNTRLQVEHPVTEQALNFDLVEAQIRIAAGEKLWITQDEVEFVAHSMEARLYAEVPERGFLPSTGVITTLNAPYEGYGVRVDAGVSEGDTITPYYDPMIAKIITTGETRHESLVRMQEMLGSMQIEGVQTNLDFLRWLFTYPQFELGNISTRFIERYYRPGAFPLAPVPVALAGGALDLLTRSQAALLEKAGAWRTSSWRQARQKMRTTLLIEGHLYGVELSSRAGSENSWHARLSVGDQTLYDGSVMLFVPRTTHSHAEDFGGTGPTVQIRLARNAATGTEADSAEPQQEMQAIHTLECGFPAPGEFYLFWEGREYWIRQAPHLSTERLNKAVRLSDEDTLESPMPGKVLRVLTAPGESVSDGQTLVIIEAMKMEFSVRAPHSGTVARVNYSEGEQVSAGDVLVEMEK